MVISPACLIAPVVLLVVVVVAVAAVVIVVAVVVVVVVADIYSYPLSLSGPCSEGQNTGHPLRPA